MSTLSESLKFITNWIRQNTPGWDLQAGLGYEQIQEATRELPFELPLEIYELYMWRNGGSLEMLPMPDLADEVDYEVIQRFFPLNEAVGIAKDWNNGWFPLFDTDGVIFWLVGTQDKQKTSPIFCNDEFDLPDEPRFQSLAEMMAASVEAVKASEIGRL
jgi:hypothetical protein